MGRFNFIGELTLSKKEDKPWTKSGTTKNGKSWINMNFGIKAANNNTAFVEGIGSEYDNIKYKTTDKVDKTVDWSDRNDSDVLKEAMYFYKRTALLNPDDQDSRVEFLSDYDLIKYIKEHIDELEGKKIQVTGQISKDIYNGNIYNRFRVSNLYVRNAEDKNGNPVKNKLQITTVFFWDKDGIDLSDWKEEKKIYINGYTEEYIDKDTGRKYVPQTMIFDCSKVDFDNEKNVKAMNFRLKQLGIELDGDKVTVKLKKNKYYTNEVEVVYYNGAEEVEFDESELTETQKEALDLGLASLEDFRPKGQIYGNRKTEWKITGFTLTGNFSEGISELDKTAEEFEDDILVVTKPETLEDAMNKPTNLDDDDPEDLFS